MTNLVMSGIEMASCQDAFVTVLAARQVHLNHFNVVLKA